MPTARDRAPLRRRLLSAFIAALAALLVFAGIAAAETKVGEATSPESAALPGEADILKATATYDTTTGSATFEITTREAPESTPAAKRPQIQYGGALATVNFPCTPGSFEAEAKRAEAEKTQTSAFPIYDILTQNEQITKWAPGQPMTQAFALFAEGPEELIFDPERFAPASKAVSGTTTTLSATIGKAVNGPFNCVEAVAELFKEGGLSETDLVVFPLAPKPAPIQTVTPPPPAQSALAPGVLSIAKAKKALNLKVGKWTTVKVKVTNTGGTATSPGSLRLKAPKGVVVKAGRQKLSGLLPGGSATVSYKVKLTAKAKKSSTLSLLGAAGGLSAKSSLVLKRVGG